MMTFDLIAPENLHAVWPTVREGLLQIKNKIKESWWPEDVFTAIRNKRSALYIVRDGDQQLGFFVCESSVEPFTHDTLLYVWCLFGPDNLSYADGCIAELDRLAQTINAKRIRFIGRHGWRKVLQGKFEAVRTVYERNLT